MLYTVAFCITILSPEVVFSVLSEKDALKLGNPTDSPKALTSLHRRPSAEVEKWNIF